MKMEKRDQIAWSGKGGPGKGGTTGERGDSLSSHATVGTVMRVPNEDFVVRIVLVLADAQKRESGRSGNSVSRHPTGHES